MLTPAHTHLLLQEDTSHQREDVLQVLHATRAAHGLVACTHRNGGPALSPAHEALKDLSEREV